MPTTDHHLLDAIGGGRLTAAELAVDMRIPVREAVKRLYAEQDRGGVVRHIATDDSAVATWSAA